MCSHNVNTEWVRFPRLRVKGEKNSGDLMGDIPANVVVADNSCKVIRKINEQDKIYY
jgi:acetyltransferase-like isoleucine patch superfamily enzyme